MNILLINPPWHQKSSNMWKYVRSCMPPFGLAILAAVLEERGHNVQILDCNAERIGLDKLSELIPSGPFDYIGVTATTVLFYNAVEVARICKERFRRCLVVLGGVHPSVFPEEALANDFVDFVVRSEGEITLAELLDNPLNPSDIPGLSYSNGHRIIHNPPRPPRPTISDLPMMAYHLLPMEKYHAALGGYLRSPSTGIIVSRGCPGRCTYCYGKYLGNRVRFRTAEQIVDEITFLMREYGIKDITFYDDTFTTFQNLVQDVCGIMIARKIDLTWCCFSRVDTVNEETLRMMKRAGCHQILYGVESADQQILKNINKNIDLEQAQGIITLTKKIGITVRTSFMIGNPGETEETIQKSIEFAKNSSSDLVSFNITTPFPGSSMFDWADANGHLITKDWKKYDLATIIMRLPTIAPESLLYYYRKAHRDFYLRPRFLLNRIMSVRSWDQFRVNVRAFLGLLKII